MQLICPSCNATILCDDINLEQMVAKCRQCQALMNVDLPEDEEEDDYDDEEDEDYGLGAPAQRPDVPMPPEFHVDRSDGRLRIVYRWWDRTVFGVVLFFCIAWSGAVYWLLTSDLSFAKSFRNTFALPVFAVALGVAAAYLALAMLVNRTT